MTTSSAGDPGTRGSRRGGVDQTGGGRRRPAPAPPNPPGNAYLLVVEDDSSSIFHLPHAGTVVIGRASDAELHLNHASVSRRHAAIRIEQGAMQVADLGSHNGTRVNGELVQDTRTLA